jgi:hypothetical protein
MSRNKLFFQFRISHVLRFISIYDLFTDSSSYMCSLFHTFLVDYSDNNWLRVQIMKFLLTLFSLSSWYPFRFTFLFLDLLGKRLSKIQRSAPLYFRTSRFPTWWSREILIGATLTSHNIGFWSSYVITGLHARLVKVNFSWYVNNSHIGRAWNSTVFFIKLNEITFVGFEVLTAWLYNAV